MGRLFAIQVVGMVLLALLDGIICMPQVVQLLSKLPPNPIETPAPDVWAWGRHPNGLDYKARNGLSLELCLSMPEVAGTALCSGNKFPLEACINNPALATLKVCEVCP